MCGVSPCQFLFIHSVVTRRVLSLPPPQQPLNQGHGSVFSERHSGSLNLSKLLLLVLLLFLTDKHRKEQHRQEQLSTKFLKLSEVANPVGVDETTFLSGLSHKNKLLAMSATHGLYNYSVNLPGRSCMALS